jgi:hypothetical protein
MSKRPLVYGLDIETDTSVDGLDPSVASVVTVALSNPAFDEVFTGPEPDLLDQLDRRLAEIEPGVLATWNGGAFDLPFLAQRAELCGLPLGLRLRHDPGLSTRCEPLPGHPGAYRARWYNHSHVDAYRLYRGEGPTLRVGCALKSIARLVGLMPLEVENSRIQQLSHEALHAHAANDARLARVLTERRWPAAARLVDRLDRLHRLDRTAVA